jgi:uncharacterized protein (DUF305 family)
MKTLFLTITLSFAAIAFAACQTATNTNNAAGHSNGDMNGMNHNAMPMNGNMMNGNGMMSNQSMMKSDPNAAASPFDLQFIDTMTAHHGSAIEMAKIAIGKTQNAELKAFAQKIISDQNKEIAQMRDWREKWFSGKPAAMNMEMPGMKSSMPDMDAAMKKLEGAAGKEFDLAFLDAMIPHHEGAVQMAKDALIKAEKPEIKTLATNIIKAQEDEIKKMQAWKTAWSK